MSWLQQKTRARDIQKEGTRISMNLPYVNVLLTNYGVYSYLAKQDPLFTLKVLFINYVVNRKSIELQNIKKIAFMILTVLIEDVYFSDSKMVFRWTQKIYQEWRLREQWNCKTLLEKKSQLYLGSYKICW